VPEVLRPDPLAAAARQRQPGRRSGPEGASSRQGSPAARVTLTVSAVLLLGVFVYLLWRYARLPLWQAAICALFGYLLAASSIGPDIADGLQNLAQFISRLHL
jgi:hypothetical protein